MEILVTVILAGFMILLGCLGFLLFTLLLGLLLETFGVDVDGMLNSFTARRSLSWTQSRGKTYLMKKIKRISKDSFNGYACYADDVFRKLFDRAAPNLLDDTDRFTEPKYAKEENQLVQMFQYALSVIEKYPLPPKGRVSVLTCCLARFFLYLPRDKTIGFSRRNLTINHFTITSVQREAWALTINFVDTLASDSQNKNYQISGHFDHWDCDKYGEQLSQILLRHHVPTSYKIKVSS